MIILAKFYGIEEITGFVITDPKLRKFQTKYQNIFPLANTFAKRENVRPGQSPTGTQMRRISTFFNGACGRH